MIQPTIFNWNTRKAHSEKKKNPSSGLMVGALKLEYSIKLEINPDSILKNWSINLWLLYKLRGKILIYSVFTSHVGRAKSYIGHGCPAGSKSACSPLPHSHMHFADLRIRNVFFFKWNKRVVNSATKSKCAWTDRQPCLWLYNKLSAVPLDDCQTILGTAPKFLKSELRYLP